jgi:hypothetical protein
MVEDTAAFEVETGLGMSSRAVEQQVNRKVEGG